MKRLCFACAIALSLAAMAFAREWSDASGQNKVEAEFVGVKDGNVVLRKPDGKLAQVPLNKLSAADQTFVQSQPSFAAPKTAEPAAPAAAEGEKDRFTQAIEKNPNDAEAVLLLANLNFDIRNWDRARELYQRHLTLQPGNPDVVTDLGVCYRELGDFKKALELFEQAQTLAPDHWQSRYNKVVVLAFDLKDYAAAERVLDELRRLQPQNPSIAELAAEVARRRGAA